MGRGPRNPVPRLLDDDAPPIPTRRRSGKQEKRLAREFGGDTTPNSGATVHQKGDVTASGLMLEAKTTGKKSYSLKAAELTGLWQDAVIDGREPVMVIQFEAIKGAPPQEWAVVPKEFLLGLMEGRSDG